jgi:hypothetical protein
MYVAYLGTEELMLTRRHEQAVTVAALLHLCARSVCVLAHVIANVFAVHATAPQKAHWSSSVPQKAGTYHAHVHQTCT